MSDEIKLESTKYLKSSFGGETADQTVAILVSLYIFTVLFTIRDERDEINERAEKINVLVKKQNC